MYKEELEAAVDDGSLTELVTAFSREQDEKVYVQHRLEQYGQKLWEEYISQGAVVYVCGDATQMAKDVLHGITNIIHQYGGKSVEEAEAEVTKMKKDHRYQEDVWHSY